MDYEIPSSRLRQRILRLPGVTERQNAGITKTPLSDAPSLSTCRRHGHSEIRLAMADQARVLAEGKARPHRWAPEQGYVTFVARDEDDLDRQWS